MSNQLVKKNPAEGYQNVFPKTWIDAIKDKESGVSLQEILQGFNMYFLSYNGSRALTRCKVPTILRKEGLWITYVLYDHTVVTEWYNSDQIDDNSWSMDSNWRVASNALVGDISVSSDGYWVINGEKTEAKAQGEQGVTPLLRVGANNKLQVSYNAGEAWKDISDYIVPKFRWNQGTGTSAGTIQISMDLGKTWTNLSNEITNNLRISRYIGINESLPTSGVAEGTIYMKGPYYNESDTSNTNPIYRMWIYAWKGNTLAWQDNGEFTAISAGVVQERGTSTTKVMSQDAVTKELTELESLVNYNIASTKLLVRPGRILPASINNGAWQITTEYHHIVVPVITGSTVKFITAANGIYYGFLQNYIIPVADTIPSYVQGYEGRQWANNPLVIPEGCNYLIIEMSEGVIPTSLIINGFELINGYGQYLMSISKKRALLYFDSLETKVYSSFFKNNVSKDYGIKSISTNFAFTSAVLKQYYNRNAVSEGMYSQVFRIDFIVDGTNINFLHTALNGTIKTGYDSFTIIKGNKKVTISLNWQPYEEELSLEFAPDTILHEVVDNSVDNIIADLPTSTDGSDIDIGYAYINAATGVVTVKLG